MIQEESRKAQGKPSRKGKRPRINLALSEELHEYVQTISRLAGVNMTEYINDLIAEDAKKNAHVLTRLEDLIKDL